MRKDNTNYQCPECKSINVDRVWFQGPGKLVCNDCDWWYPGFGETPIGFDNLEPIVIEPE